MERSWAQVPIQHRLATYAVLPAVAAMQFLGGRQRLLSPEAEINDLPTPHDEVPAIVRGLLDRHGYRVRTAEWLTVVAG